MGYSNDPSGFKRSLATARAEIERLTKERDEARQIAEARAGGLTIDEIIDLQADRRRLALEVERLTREVARLTLAVRRMEAP